MAANQHDREFWERAFREVEAGAKPGDVARRLGVRPRTLTWWCWKLRREQPTRKRSRRTRFLPVVAEREAEVDHRGPVVLDACGVRVHVEVGTDIGYVIALVRAIRAQC